MKNKMKHLSQQSSTTVFKLHNFLVFEKTGIKIAIEFDCFNKSVYSKMTNQSCLFSYRDGVQHHSILSSLSASYNGIGELSYYDDMAKNLDANLAEVDMENFRSEDINSLLHIQQEEGTKPKRKLILKDQNEFDNSICKSEILFSPVKESHISVDSLDMDGYADDIILTCQANKNNYTIAFEGSCMYSDDSYYGKMQ